MQDVQIQRNYLEVSAHFVYNGASLTEGGVLRGRRNRDFLYHDKKDYEIHEIVQQVYDALKEKGYNPVNQLVGYILSEDPTYITTYKNARAMIRKVDRDDLLQAMLRSYLNV